MLKKLIRKFSSIEIMKNLQFTKQFYKAVEERLIKNNKFLILDIVPGEGCGGFTYEFKSLKELPNKNYLLFKKNIKKRRQDLLCD